MVTRNKVIASSLFILISAAAIYIVLKAPTPTAPASPPPAVQQNDMLNAADPENGYEITRACTACHAFEKGDLQKKVGPNLFGIYNKPIASREGYEYSDALLVFKDKTWTADTLYDWLRDPSEFAPGTKMSYGGLLDPQDRMDVISYLMTLK